MIMKIPLNLQVRPDETSYRIEGLDPSTTYAVRIKGQNKFGPGEMSEEKQFITLEG